MCTYMISGESMISAHSSALGQLLRRSAQTAEQLAPAADPELGGLGTPSPLAPPSALPSLMNGGARARAGSDVDSPPSSARGGPALGCRQGRGLSDRLSPLDAALLVLVSDQSPCPRGTVACLLRLPIARSPVYGRDDGLARAVARTQKDVHQLKDVVREIHVRAAASTVASSCEAQPLLSATRNRGSLVAPSRIPRSYGRSTANVKEF